MPEITGKTVYVLGAGASFHVGAPLLADFLVTARLLRDGKEQLVHKDSFDRVFNWIDKLRGSSYYVEFDLDNLEHVFSLAEMGKQLKLAGAEQIFTDLRYLVTETLDICRLTYSDKQLLPSPAYDSFVKLLVQLNEAREKLVGPNFRRDAIITFNYDVSLDYALRFNGIPFNYDVEATNTSDFVLLKLHGSTNWARCQQCDAPDLQLVAPSPLAPGQYIDPLFQSTGAYQFKMVTNVLGKTKCNKCDTVGKLEPYVIPPTWSKMVEGSPLQKVWARAVDEIKSAYQIVVIGYSMPATDTFFQYLLTLGLQTNAGFHRVVVVNRDSSGPLSSALKERYSSVFSRSLIDRGRLQFHAYGRFEDFVGWSEGLLQIGKSV